MAGVGLCVEIHISGPQLWPTESGLAKLGPSVFSEAPKYDPISPLGCRQDRYDDLRHVIKAVEVRLHALPKATRPVNQEGRTRTQNEFFAPAFPKLCRQDTSEGVDKCSH